MKQISRWLTVCFVASVVLSIVDTRANQGSKVSVEGAVTSGAGDGVPIIGVIIRADRDGRTVGQAKSDSSGFYRLEVDEGSAFDLVYDHSSWHPDTFKRLSGTKSHTVNKVLYRPGSEQVYSSAVVFGILSGYEHIHFLALAGGASVGGLREAYAGRLSALQVARFDGEVGRLIEGKRQRVLGLFGMGLAVADRGGP
jgi:hypothetical protein